MDHEKKLAHTVQQQELEIEKLRKLLRNVGQGLEIVEQNLEKAAQANPADAPFPLTPEQANLWHRASASAYQHALEMCGSQELRQFIANESKQSELIDGANTLVARPKY